MLFKRVLCLFSCLTVCLFAGCTDKEDTATEAPTQTAGISEPMSYADYYAEYMDSAVNVTSTLTVDMEQDVENKFSLSYENGGYVLTDLKSGKTVSYDEDASEAEIFKIAGYLPPYENAYESEGGYGVRFSGDLALELLLSGSNLFDGYSPSEVTLEGECAYFATVGDGIESYSYDFSINVDDGGVKFPAKIKYLIEVNK